MYIAQGPYVSLLHSSLLVMPIPAQPPRRRGEPRSPALRARPPFRAPRSVRILALVLVTNVVDDDLLRHLHDERGGHRARLHHLDHVALRGRAIRGARA